MTEYVLDITDSAGVTPGISRVLVHGGLVRPGTIFDFTAQIGTWTVPEGVESFTVQIGGALATPFGTGGGSPSSVPEQAVFYDVPCTPGDQWLLEPGDSPGGQQPYRLGRNTLHGGDGGAVPSPTTDDDFGYAGAGASILWRRTTSDEVLALMGGQGGAGVDADGSRIPELIVDEAPAGATSYGGFTDLSGGSSGTDTSYLAGGGGGGYPGGAAATADATAGTSGGSYLPDVSGSSLGGAASPAAGDIASIFPVAPLEWRQGIVAIWYWTPVPKRAAWSVDEIKF